MAQVDTGLGWSAKGEWLLSANSKLCDIAGTPDPADFYPVPYLSAGMPLTYGTVKTVGLAFATDPDTGNIGYIAVDSDSVYICSNRTVESPGKCKLLSAEPFTAYYSRSDWRDSTTIPGYLQPSATYNSEYGVYTLALTNGAFTFQNVNTLNPLIPIYETYADALTAFVGSSMRSYFKLNNGAAVACVAQWVTTEGTTLLSPVLISTVPEHCTITTDGTTPAQPQSTFNFLYDGVVFYMSLIPGIDGDSVYETDLETANLVQFAAAAPVKIFRLIADDSFSNIQLSDSPDPYGGNAEEDGGSGEDPEDDPVEEETMPIPPVVGLGFSTIYVPTQTDLFNLAAYLWSGNLDLTNFLRLFANPMDSILGLSAVPLVLSGTYEPIYLGGQLLQGITMPKYTGRTAVKVDMGTVTIKERWGAYLDYDPYTELAAYIPFVGIKNIKADDVMGKTVRLMYDIDILSGACIAYLRPEGGSVLYEWSGQCAMQIPITGANWDNIFSTAINTAATLGGALFAPASAPVLGGAVASAASQAIAAKPRIERSGAVNGITGFLGQLRPYIIRTIPEAYIPNDQNKFIGYPSYISVNLGQLTGYNEIASIHLENIPATGDELSELESILKGGAIF